MRSAPLRYEARANGTTHSAAQTCHGLHGVTVTSRGLQLVHRIHRVLANGDKRKKKPQQHNGG